MLGSVWAGSIVNYTVQGTKHGGLGTSWTLLLLNHIVFVDQMKFYILDFNFL